MDTTSMEARENNGRVVEAQLANGKVAALDETPEKSNEKAQVDAALKKPAWLRFLAHVGPGFLVSLAYLDPGNLQTDLQAGSSDQFQLLWVILIGLIFALIIQSLAANLGVVTGKHLAELCRSEYPPFLRICLWLLSELAVIAADVPEVIGTAFALNILFNIPVWSGVLITGCSTLLLLGLQRFGVRKLEFLIAMMVFILAACFFGEMSFVKPPADKVLKGLFIPQLHGPTATGDAVALLGALIMPHNLFLHSALVLSRKTPPSVRGIKDACKFFLLESAFALFIALLINIAVVSVTATICSANNLSAEDVNNCNDLTLNSASFLLRNILGKSSAIVYGVALLASGQSSTITGTYAGQYVMQGFLNIRMKKWQRNLMTRFIAIAPSLVASIVGGPAVAGQLIIIASMILSFELPFALIPLLKFSGSRIKMGPHKTHIIVCVISWLLGLMIIGINIYFLTTTYVGWLTTSTLPKYANVLISLIVFPIMAFYLIAIIYLAVRRDRVVTFVPSSDQLEMEKGEHRGEGAAVDEPVPFREDLADIPFPR